MCEMASMEQHPNRRLGMGNQGPFRVDDVRHVRDLGWGEPDMVSVPPVVQTILTESINLKVNLLTNGGSIVLTYCVW